MSENKSIHYLQIPAFTKLSKGIRDYINERKNLIGHLDQNKSKKNTFMGKFYLILKKKYKWDLSLSDHPTSQNQGEILS